MITRRRSLSHNALNHSSTVSSESSSSLIKPKTNSLVKRKLKEISNDQSVIPTANKTENKKKSKIPKTISKSNKQQKKKSSSSLSQTESGENPGPGPGPGPDSESNGIIFKFGTMSREFDKNLLQNEGFKCICGTDEAGRGPLAGPVVCAAAIVPSDVFIAGVNDSKKLNEQQRDFLYSKIIAEPKIKWSVSVVSALEIDEINILQASLLGMDRAVSSLSNNPDIVLVDGPHLPKWENSRANKNNFISRPIIKGDSISYSIAVASIIAKVERDKLMYELDKKYPQYGFAQHKGYPTRAHVSALYKHGPCPEHRKTFTPVNKLVDRPESKESSSLAIDDGKKRKPSNKKMAPELELHEPVADDEDSHKSRRRRIPVSSTPAKSKKKLSTKSKSK